MESIDVCVLMLGIDAAERERVQREFEAIASSGNTSSVGGLVAMLGAAIGLLRAVEGSWTHAAAENSLPMPASEAEAKFRAAVHRARSRFTHEIVRNYDGHVTTEQAPESALRGQGPGVVVVTLAVAARSELADVRSARDRVELDHVLDALRRLESHELVALEVVWSPADPRDRPSIAEVEAKYPELTRLLET